MYRMTTEEFERAIDEALASIPPEFLQALENVAIVAQDEPSAYQLGRAASEEDVEWADEEIAAWAEEGFFDGEAEATDGEASDTLPPADEGLSYADADEDAEFDEESDLLGLYDGIPLTERDDYAWDVPDVITVFKGPHERLCGSREEMVEEIRKTVVHEIGHYFGMDEGAIEEMGYA